MKIDLTNKKFKSINSSDNGEVNTETIFLYNQTDDIIYADYYGGCILKGQLLGKVINNEYIEFTYHHLNDNMEMMTGKCTSFPELDMDGKIILKETWQWTCKDRSCGKSVLKEI